MSGNCFSNSKRSARAGLTLVEVVAGIVLLATLLVSILASFRAHAAQIRAAQNRLEAIHVADNLLATWMSEGVFPAVGEQEVLPNSPGWSWRMVRCQPSEEIRRLGAAAVRLEIFKMEASEKSPERVLTSVELLVQGNTRSNR